MKTLRLLLALLITGGTPVFADPPTAAPKRVTVNPANVLTSPTAAQLLAANPTLGTAASRQTFSGTTVTVTSGTTLLARTGGASAATVTLPLASSYLNGTGFWLADEGRTTSFTNSVVLARAGSDTINGGSSQTITATGFAIYFTSDGASKWTASKLPGNIGAGFDGLSFATGTAAYPSIDIGGIVITQAATAYLSSLGAATVAGGLGQFTPTTSSVLASYLTDETGTGAAVFGISPTLTSPTLNTPTLTTPALGTIASGVGTALTALNANNITSGTTLPGNVTGSSLTTVGTLQSLNVNSAGVKINALTAGSVTLAVPATVQGSGNYTLTFDIPGTGTVTYPAATFSVARSDAAQTFTGAQAFSGVINLAATTSASLGVLQQNGTALLHTYGAAGNVFVGANGLASGNTSLVTGVNNVGLGGNTLIALTSGHECVAVGNSAMAAVTTGVSLTAFGSSSLNAVSTGSIMLAVGTYSLKNCTAAGQADNTAVGPYAGYGCTTGTANTWLGEEAGYTNPTTGDHCTLLGWHAEAGAAGATYRTALGAGATSTANNQIMLGRATETVVTPGPLTALGTLAVTGTSTLTGVTTLGDSGTATATAGAATLNKQLGVITTESLTTAGGAAYTLTLTNSAVSATSRVFASVCNGTNTVANYHVETVTEASGSVAIVIRNNTAATPLNGTLKIKFVVW